MTYPLPSNLVYFNPLKEELRTGTICLCFCFFGLPLGKTFNIPLAFPMRVRNLNPTFYTVEFVIVFTCLCVSVLRQVAAIFVRLSVHDEVQINSWYQVANQNPPETTFAEKVLAKYRK